MKKLIVTTLAALLAVSLTTSVPAETPIDLASNAVQQAKQTLAQAESALKTAESLGKTVTSAVAVSTGKTNTTEVSTNTPTTNTTPAVASVASTNSPVKETINDAVIDILRGVKSAGGEIYQTSKMAIAKAVDFTMEQAPLVVTEFLHWKFAESLIYFVIFLIPSIAFFYFGRAMRLKAESEDVPKEDKYKADKRDYSAGKWVFRTIGLIILTINLAVYVPPMTKILVAPRVYLIEYVANVIQGHNTAGQ